MEFLQFIGFMVIFAAIPSFIFFIGYTAGASTEKDLWHEFLVDRGLAQYNNFTGDWEMIPELDE